MNPVQEKPLLTQRQRRALRRVVRAAQEALKTTHFPDHLTREFRQTINIVATCERSERIHRESAASWDQAMADGLAQRKAVA